MSEHPQTIITTTTLTETVTTTDVYVPATTEIVTTTEAVTTTETEVNGTQEIIQTELETWIEEYPTLTTTVTTQWVPVMTTTTIETHTETETAVTYTTVTDVEKTFTYTQLVWTDTVATTLTTLSQAVTTETVIPADGTTTLTEIYIPTETLAGTTQTSIYMTTITGVRTATTVITIPADVPGYSGWFPAGTVITLDNVDDEADLLINGEVVGRAVSNGWDPPPLIPGKVSYTIPEDGYYTISISNYLNYGGPSYEGDLDFGGVPVVYTSQPGITTTTTQIVVDPGTVTKIPVDWTVTEYYTITDTAVMTETFVPASDETTTTEIQTVTVVTLEVETETQTQIVTETEGVVSYETITISTYPGMTLTDTVATTLTLGGGWRELVIPTNTLTTRVASTIKSWIEYVPVTYNTVTTTKTLTTLTVPLITQTQTDITVPALTVTVTTTLADLDCFGGVYYGFVPVEDVYRNGNVIEHIRQGTDAHCIIL